MHSSFSQAEATGWLANDSSTPVFEPQNVQECREWLRQRHLNQEPIWIVGRGSQLFLGNQAVPPSYILSTRRLEKILEYSPADLTVTVQAGCPLSTLNQALGEGGQFLPLFPINHNDATLGGIIATGLDGLLVTGYGKARDYLIGIETLLPEGIFSRAGGRVVKNVAGYDLCKLHVGALGTLGLITTLTFKVCPRPTCSKTILIPVQGLSRGFDLSRELGAVKPAIKEWIYPGKGISNNSETWGLSDIRQPTLILRFLDTAEVLAWKLEHLQAIAPDSAPLNQDSEKLFWSEWDSLWRRVTHPKDPWMVFRAKAPQAQVVELARWLVHLDPQAHLFLRPASGTIYYHTLDRSLLEQLDEMRKEWLSREVFITLLKAPVSQQVTLDRWGLSTQDLTLMKAIKASFDPHAILNRGRFWGGI